MEASGSQQIIFFYDGSCGMCSRLVRFIHAYDSKQIVYFAPIGGLAYAEKVSGTDAVDENAYESSYFYDGTQVLTYSDAVLAVLCRLHGWPRVIGYVGLKLSPRRLRNALYRLVARNRYRITKMLSNSCEMPAKSLRQRILN